MKGCPFSRASLGGGTIRSNCAGLRLSLQLCFNSSFSYAFNSSFSYAFGFPSTMPSALPSAMPSALPSALAASTIAARFLPTDFSGFLPTSQHNINSFFEKDEGCRDPEKDGYVSEDQIRRLPSAFPPVVNFMGNDNEWGTALSYR